jgi:hypothetical protein
MRSLILAGAVASQIFNCGHESQDQKPDDWSSPPTPAEYKSAKPAFDPDQYLRDKKLDEKIESIKSIGRYQVVNPTPQMARNIMLVDTVGGDSWVMCLGPHGETGWCHMPSSDGAASMKGK